MPTQFLKNAILTAAKFSGLFALSSAVTAKHLRILCYHGVSVADEAKLKPVLFMDASKFASRMALLERLGYEVIGLGHGVNDLRSGRTLRKKAVITIDDGWFGTYDHMVPDLVRRQWPATIYVSSYYVTTQTQVYNVAIDYVLEQVKPQRETLRLLENYLDAQLAGDKQFDAQRVRNEIVAHIDKQASAAARQASFVEVCQLLKFDAEAVVTARQFSFMNASEVGRCIDQGIDIQLHTHRHRFSADCREDAEREIADNRSALLPMGASSTSHFCYPSGEYKVHQFEWLRNLEIDSATTTELGLNGPGQSVYELRRILDSNDMPDIQFEAELSGFSHLVRRLLKKLRASEKGIGHG